jgi:hypothetical protein
MLNSLGVTTADLQTFHVPTRIRRLTIPRVAFEEQNFAHKALLPMCHKIGASVLGNRERVRNERPGYFTKTGLSGGVTRFSNEAEVIDILAQNGIDILMPERMSFADQLYEFATRTIVLGSSSSAFHTSIFMPPHARQIVITPTDLLNSNFVLIDKVNGNVSDYYHPAGGATQDTDPSDFMLSSRIPNPGELAREILKLI